MHATISVGKIAYTGKNRVNEVEIEMRLEDKGKGKVLSICGNIWMHKRSDCYECGQNLDEILKYYNERKLTDKRIPEIVSIWKRWHLNDMKAGTPKQEAAIEDWTASGAKYDYTKACEYLESIGLLVDNGYKYGTAWLCEPLPVEVENRIKELFAA